MSIHNLLPINVTPRAIRGYINFDGGAQIDLEGTPQSKLQSEGVAAIWHLLEKKNYAYLADEVGMGKTRQAMGVIAMQFLSDPASHVVIVCPGRPLQDQWAREWDTFIRTCYKAGDDRLVSSVDGRPLHIPHIHERLSDFSKALLLNESRIHLLRYSSFSRPVWLAKTQESNTPEGVLNQYAENLLEIGISMVSMQESALAVAVDPKNNEWRAILTEQLNEEYAKRIGTILRERNIDLITLDEAQYLRHTHNRQNTNLAHVFRTHVKKWQFLSATPLHSGRGDIQSLDVYLCNKPDGFKKGEHCGACDSKETCSRATYRMTKESPEKLDVVDLLSEFMVRRPRSFKDGDTQLHGKIQYRRYERTAVSAGGDPFLALTMALVQKRLVHALDGGANRFRQGECSSFESLAASVRRMRSNRDSPPVIENEIEGKSSTKKDEPDETPDRASIDALNQSFRNAMLISAKNNGVMDPRYNLPHAKLNHVADALTRSNLVDGSIRKTLVFVRRLDTVDELVLLLNSRFQIQVNARLTEWHSFLEEHEKKFPLRAALWDNNTEGFWSSPDRNDNVALHDDGETNIPPEDTGAELRDKIARLPYMAALRRSTNKEVKNGMLSSFQSRLLAPPSRGPFDGFLLSRFDETDDNETPALWDIAEGNWHRFVTLITGIHPAFAAEDDKWLFGGGQLSTDLVRKLATLKRCILQSMRQSDFIVDLYVVNRFIQMTTKTIGAPPTLTEKLLWLLDRNACRSLPEKLEAYVENWRHRLGQWFVHFDLIVDKCLRKDGARTWHEIYSKVDGTFARMAPIMGRSGRLKDKNAVAQFNFPTHPNILVCTDVLKEGVDMHLFCDEVVHYGVAWTSGDLEQRIGRVDRFGSLISRRIAAHQQSIATKLPHLKVEFPYLDGTLDKFQVERVITAKIKSDLRMDLGKREDEIGVISLDGITLSPEAVEEGNTLQVMEKLQYYPSSTPIDSGAIGDNTSPLYTTRITAPPDPDFVHAPELSAMIVRNSASSTTSNLLRRKQEPGAKRGQVLIVQEEYLIPRIEGEAFSRSIRHTLSKALAAGPPLAITTIPFQTLFNMSEQWNTLSRQIKVINPFDPQIGRTHSVLLEKVGDYLLLRTPIVDLHESGEKSSADWDNLVLQTNKKRKWGYLSKDNEIIWFVCFVYNVTGSLPAGMLDILAERVGKIGDRLQHLHCGGGDHEEWTFRSHAGLSSLVHRNTTTSPNATYKKKTFMTKNEELLDCGALLLGVQKWFTDAFEMVLNALYEDKETDRGLHSTAVTLLPGGVLHIETEGNERFNIDAYLQLTEGTSGDIKYPSPRIIWQIAASTHNTGKKPRLGLYGWDQLPHMAPALWNTDIRDSCAVCLVRDESYRYLTLYHAPGDWDAGRNELLSAWKKIRTKMNGKKFMMKDAQELFFRAIPEQTAITGN
jgi:hypothetical protein